MPIDAVTLQRFTNHLVDKTIRVQVLAESEELQKTVSGDLGLSDGVLKDYIVFVLEDQGSSGANFEARQSLQEAGLLVLPKAEPESASETSPPAAADASVTNKPAAEAGAGAGTEAAGAEAGGAAAAATDAAATGATSTDKQLDLVLSLEKGKRTEISIPAGLTVTLD